MNVENQDHQQPGDQSDGVFRFKRSIPPEVLPVVRQHFLAQAWLVPPWCQLVVVHWGGDGHPEANMEVGIEYEYRWASITVYPSWLGSDDAIRRENVIHELTHISVNLIADYARGIVETLLKDDAPRFYATVEAELRRRCEAATQDLAYLIARKADG